MLRLRSLLLWLPFLCALPSVAQVAGKVRLLCNWNDTAQAPLNVQGGRYSEVWGFTVREKEYGVIGSTRGAHIIDLDGCRQVAFAAARNTGAIHRDYKTYKHYLYAVTDDGISTLQIFDLSYLPDSLHMVYESDPQDLSRAHKIFIDTATAKLYCASPTGLASGHDYMRVYSLQKPDSPVLLTVYNYGGDVHDMYVRHDTAYCSSSFFGYVVADFTHPPGYNIIGLLKNYPYKGFNHSSWINGAGIGVMADETFGFPLKVIDASRVDDIKVPGTFSPRPGDSTCVPHNPYVAGHFAFISYYFDGLQIYDLTDPQHPVQAGYYHTYPGPPEQGYRGAWGCYPFLPSRRVLVSDMQTGLYVLDADEALGIQKEASFSLFPNPARDHLSLQFPYGLSGILEANIYDIEGRKVSRQSATLSAEANPPITLSLPDGLPGGVYIIRCIIGGHVFSAPFTNY